jgi:N-acetylglucosaminyldiphosphoundecaprenol N-acetyl-beta-D-mannosaminyltransferase
MSQISPKPNTDKEPPSYGVLGVRVRAVQIPDVVTRMEGWIAEESRSHFIAVTGMHGIVEAQHDVSFKEILEAADLVVPDGMPLVWLGRMHGYSLRRRVYGPELTENFCKVTRKKYRHFFYGGALGVAETLAEHLSRRHGICVAGTYSPPFRPLTAEEDREITELINVTKSDVVWVGLGTPKQERWMFEHRKSVNAPVLIGVGAAFDFLTGRVTQAPPWMREHGLECLFRFCQDPLRLWRRYVIYGSEFAWKASLEAIGLRKF